MPRTDTRDPIVVSVTAPAETTNATVPVTVSASDPDGNAIVKLRIADENGDFGAWRPWTPSFEVALTNGIGTKRIYVQVMDEPGRVSEANYAVVQRKPIPDLADPVVTVTAPQTSTTNTIGLSIVASDDIGVTAISFCLLYTSPSPRDRG